MREVVATFQKGFAVGLRKNPSVANTTECLSECYNFVVTSEGLQPREEVIEPLPFALDWPFPILYIGSNNILYFTRKSVYGIGADWSPYLIYTVSNGWGGCPHFADFQEYIIWATPFGTWQYKNDTVLPFTEWTGETACNYRSQLLMGEAKLPKGPERAKDGTIIDASVDIPSTGIIAWGIIGDTEFRYQIGQENGWMILPYIGKTLAAIPMGEMVYVYHQNGIQRLTPVQQPLPTFGAATFGNIGPISRDCVAGDNSAHLMLGSDRELYIILPEKALSDQGKMPISLDYREFMKNLVDPIVTFDSVRRQWWIGDKNRCFIYNGTGLSEASYTPTMLGNYHGQLLACGSTHGDDSAIATINAVSINTRAMKTLMTVEADIRADAATGQVLWRTDFRKPLQASPEKTLDPRGFFFPVVSGTELEVRIKTSDFRNTHLSKLWLRYKATDRTSVRGVMHAGASQDSQAD